MRLRINKILLLPLIIKDFKRFKIAVLKAKDDLDII